MKSTMFLSILIIIIGCHTSDVDTLQAKTEYLNSTVQYKTIDGVSRDLLSLDIYYNNHIDHKKPVVIYVHGGGWSLGDKANQLDNKISLFRSLDYILVSVNYRLSPFPYETSNAERIKFPDHNTDVADAVKWVYDNIDGYGGSKNKMALLGHSAGAHLVALTGTNKNFLEQTGLTFSAIKGVAVIDTEGFDIVEQIANGSIREMYVNAFGIDHTANIGASPIKNLNSIDHYPRFFIAKRGSAKRIAYADQFIDELLNFDIEVSQINGSIYTHQGINEAIGKENETIITDPLIEFFDQCFK